MKKHSRYDLSDSDASETSGKTSKNVDSHRDGSSSEENSSDAVQQPAPVRRIEKLSPTKSARLNPLEEFIRQNSNLTRLTIYDIISKDEEVSILKVPRTIDPRLFIGKAIKSHKRSKIKLNGVKYVIEPSDEEVQPINLLTSKLQILHPISVLKMREYKKHLSDMDAVDVEFAIPALPENLKVRHPLFGSDYKQKIVLNDEVEKKLDFAIKGVLAKLKKKKKHRESSQSLDVSAYDTDVSVKKKHKKKDIVMDPESIFHKDSSNSFHEASFDAEMSKKKKTPKKKDEADTTSIFDRQRSDSWDLSGFETKISLKGKEHRKKETDEGNENMDMRGFENDTSVKRKKHKKKDLEREPSFDVANEESIEDISPLVKAHKKKKHKVKEESPEASTSFACFNNFEKKTRQLQKSKKTVSEIEEDNHVESRKRKNSVKTELMETDTSGFETDTKSEKKKKNRIKQEIIQQSDGESGKHKKNKYLNSTSEEDKKRNSIINSTVLPDLQLPLFDFDVSSIGNKEGEQDDHDVTHTKKKKKKISDVDVPNETIDSVESWYNGIESAKKKKRAKQETDDEDSGYSPKKKQRIVKKEAGSEDEETNSLISSLLSKVKTEINPRTRKKP